MYSPAAIESAPATSPAMPVSITLLFPTPLAATPTTRLETDTTPSFAPRTAARSQPIRWERWISFNPALFVWMQARFRVMEHSVFDEGH